MKLKIKELNILTACTDDIKPITEKKKITQDHKKPFHIKWVYTSCQY